jgi:Protein of unknown function (DUF3800)
VKERFVHLVYCDDTREGKKHQFLTAVILKDADFQEVELYLRGIAQLDVPAEIQDDFEFHASELYNGKIPGIDRPKALEIFTHCAGIGTQAKIPIIYSRVDLKTMAKSIYASATPLDIAFRLCLPEIERWFRENATDELGIVICDDCNDKNLKDRLLTSYMEKRERVQTKVKRIGTKLNVSEYRGELPHLHDAMYFGSSKYSTGIQLADIFGYIINQHSAGNADTEILYNWLEPLIFASVHEPKEN